MTDLTTRLRAYLRLAEPVSVAFRRGGRVASDGVVRETVGYAGLEGDPIQAFLFLPGEGAPRGGVVFFHQHGGAFHLGKSEVAGDEGDPFQAFGPALARRGVAVLAPDALTFEDRRAAASGVAPDDGDWLQHYNAMAYRLLEGDLLMRKVLDDAQRALGVLRRAAGLDAGAIGVAGHSYGGLVALYHAALDTRCRFACISGALCSFEARRHAGTGINMFEVVPGLTKQLETHDLLAAIAPRPVLVVSATDDPYSRDADQVVARAATASITEVRVHGGHALDRERFDAIVAWIAERAGAS